MEEQFIPYELALKLKELGFDEKCFGFYFENESFYLCSYCEESYITSQTYDYYNVIGKVSCSAPLWQQAFDWFRNNDIFSEVYRHPIYKTFCYSIQVGTRNCGGSEFETYKNAELECLKKLIEIYEINLRLCQKK